jgi:hypothetical protein
LSVGYSGFNSELKSCYGEIETNEFECVIADGECEASIPSTGDGNDSLACQQSRTQEFLLMFFRGVKMASFCNEMVMIPRALPASLQRVGDQ